MTHLLFLLCVEVVLQTECSQYDELTLSCPHPAKLTFRDPNGSSPSSFTQPTSLSFGPDFHPLYPFSRDPKLFQILVQGDKDSFTRSCGNPNTRFSFVPGYTLSEKVKVPYLGVKQRISIPIGLCDDFSRLKVNDLVLLTTFGLPSRSNNNGHH